jgi:hypothetical protein
VNRKKRKSRIISDFELKEMNERIKKKKESGKKDIFDYIGDIISVPYQIRGGTKKGGMMKASKGGEARGGGAAIRGKGFKGIF